MWDLLKLWLFAHTYLLTPQPIGIDASWRQIQIKEPLEVLNSRARLELDVTATIDAKGDVIERLNGAKSRYPHGCIEARLTSKGGRESVLSNTGEAVTNEETFVIVRYPNGFEPGLQFTSLAVRANCPLSSAKVLWHNMGK
jgi:hypothetical protein